MANDRIAEYWIGNLDKPHAAGSIFYLKAAFHYKDRFDITSGDKQLPTPILATQVNINKDEDERTDKEIQ